MEQGEYANKSLAAVAFLKLLIFLRKVIIQDCGLLMDIYPDLYLWKLDIFQSEDFQSYTVEIRKNTR